MFSKLTLKLTKFALNRANLSMDQKLEITTILFDKIVAFPIHDIITYNEEGKLLVNGNLLDAEQVRRLRESAKGVLESGALEFVHNQLRYEAMKVGINQSKIIEDTLFAKAVIYCGEQERKLLRTLAG